MSSAAPRSKTVPFLVWALICYGIFSVIYSLYSAMTSQGVAGQIAARQMEWFGGASLVVTFCLTMVIFGLFPLILAFIVGFTVWPSLGEALSALFVAQPAKPASAQAPVAASAPAVSRGMRWSTVLKTAVILFGITGALASVLYFLNVREHNLGVYRLNLDAPGALPGRIGYVRLTGTLVRSQAITYREGDSLHLLVPVVERAWAAGKPARYFIHYHHLGTDPAQFGLPREFRLAGANEFTGTFAGRLPVFADRELAKKNANIDKDYRILEWEQIPSEGTPMGDSHLIVLIIGGFLSLSLLAIMVAMKLRGA